MTLIWEYPAPMGIAPAFRVRAMSRAGLATLLTVSSIAVFGLSVLVSALTGNLGALEGAVGGVFMFLFAGIGLGIIRKVPGNGIGWIFLILAAGAALVFLLALVLTALGLPEAAEWLGHWTWVLPVAIPATVVLQLFPDSRPLSPRWRYLLWVTAVAITGFTFGQMFGEFLGGSEEYGPNPYHIEAVDSVAGMVGILIIPALIGSVASLVLRFRRSRHVQRQQIKWVAYSAVVALVGLVTAGVGGELSIFGNDVADGIVLGSIALIPMSIGLGIVRYRLYDIDRLISRTVSYALVVLVLTAIYVVGTVWLPTNVTGGDSPLFIAGSTLAAAALFNPLRRTVLRAVDRRFNRSRFDPEEISQDLASRLQAQTDVGHVADEWVGVVATTLQPAAIGVWVRSHS